MTTMEDCRVFMARGNTFRQLGLFEAARADFSKVRKLRQQIKHHVYIRRRRLYKRSPLGVC